MNSKFERQLVDINERFKYVDGVQTKFLFLFRCKKDIYKYMSDHMQIFLPTEGKTPLRFM